MNPKTIENIRDDYQDGKYKTKLPMVSQSKYKEGHVFDENQSVLWNREEVKKQNALIQEKIEERRKDSFELEKQLERDILAAMAYEYDQFNSAQLQKIYDHVYSEKHSHFVDVFSGLYETLDLFEAVKNLERE